MRERWIEQKVCTAAKRHGWLVHPKIGAGARGWPDRTFSKSNQLIFVEFKAPGKKPTRLQAHCHERLRAEGYDVHVIDSVEAGAALFSAGRPSCVSRARRVLR